MVDDLDGVALGTAPFACRFQHHVGVFPGAVIEEELSVAGICCNLCHFLRLAFPAFFIAIATACFWGRPECISSRILAETAALLRPFLSGTLHHPLAAHHLLLHLSIAHHLAAHHVLAALRHRVQALCLLTLVAAFLLCHYPLTFAPRLRASCLACFQRSGRFTGIP